ncbi:Glucose-repressible alcohol dehydrogenase transcriptional effector [Puccinia graminis f. sp. tritici]|uniref:CCR4-Not complex 3'-5'-exoribonuclease subunit Ccr4 n=1 Tax=Puccinia graminis f. sp. tritici TaxID=56615 RepID=A0A5B0R986_PUCGR|nr:Glucose-repressible alcohol dehydrogenase transcriptional effector [Puccinia graminis f. sp. tritici]
MLRSLAHPVLLIITPEPHNFRFVFNDHSDPLRHQNLQSLISSNSSNQSDRTNPNSPTDTSLTSSTATANGAQNEGSMTHHKLHSQNRSSNTGWTTVDMGGLKLKSLSEALFSYDFLTTLYIPHNSLTSLSPSIAQLNSLTILDVSSNKLTSLPPELGMITTLQHLFELGVEGNPLTDTLLSTIQKEGTASLVAYLRDSCPVPLPPSERDWITIDSDLSNHHNDHHGYSPPPETFTTMCYNILCERYATDRMYGYTPSWALNWEYRKDLILQEIMQYGADIICLQEVDVEQYEDFFVQSLKDQGYEGRLYLNRGARTMGSEERRHVDGCATFFKTSISHKTEDMFNRVMTKDNIAVIALLEHRQSGTRQIVANVHIHWDPEFRDVKLIQTAMLMDQISEISSRFARLPKRTNLSNNYRTAPSYSDGTQIPTIICGDFNSIPQSGVYDYLSQGLIPSTHPDFCVIDYIWYSTESLQVIGLLGKIDDAYLKKVVGFPNAHFASDHVPVLAEFKSQQS